jgi:hypothetical protein
VIGHGKGTADVTEPKWIKEGPGGAEGTRTPDPHTARARHPWLTRCDIEAAAVASVRHRPPVIAALATRLATQGHQHDGAELQRFEGVRRSSTRLPRHLHTLFRSNANDHRALRAGRVQRTVRPSGALGVRAD